VIVAILVVIFLIAAINVFNPSFHPDLIVTAGGPGLLSQIRDFFSSSGGYAGSILLLVIAGIVAWVLSRSK
jgi:hypothetical protein